MERTISIPATAMASNCILCGIAISQGILCANCDRPRKPKAQATAAATLPLDVVSPAIATVSNILVAAGAPAVILDSDRSVRLTTEQFKSIVGEITNVRQIEESLGVAIHDLTKLSTSTLSLRSRKFSLSIVPF